MVTKYENKNTCIHIYYSGYRLSLGFQNDIEMSSIPVIQVNSMFTWLSQMAIMKFPYHSVLRIHKEVHSKLRLYYCFSGGCNKTYKWQQDLHRHVQKHLQRKYQEKRMLPQHMVKHSDNISAQGVTIKGNGIYRRIYRGRARCTPSPMGPNSFIFAYIFTKKHPCQRSTPPQWVHAAPYGKSWIRQWYSPYHQHLKTCKGELVAYCSSLLHHLQT